MFYTIYKTTNTVNGKFYIGKHKTKNLDDGYLGSGKILKRAIAKYGLENFHKEILYIWEDEDHMNLIETILVVPDREINYNLCDGGYGGWSFVNSTCHNNKANARQTGNYGFKVTPTDRTSTKHRKTISDGLVHAYRNGLKNGFLNKSHSPETKKKIGEKSSAHQAGSKNSQFGTCWITDGRDNRKIRKEELDKWVALGWRSGRQC